MTAIKAWIQASRLPSQLYIFTPILLGQSIAYGSLTIFNSWDLELFFLLTLYGFFIQLYIIYGNDYADQETDSLNETYTIFSGGSRVITDRLISPRAIRNAAILMAGLSFFVTMILMFQGLYLAPIFWLFSILLLWMYSYPPIQLSYRGGGEILQTIGVGIVLPVFSYYTVAGNLIDFPWKILIILIPTQFACAIATSIPDQISDRVSNKNTITVAWGDSKTRLAIYIFQLLSLIFGTILYSHIFWIGWISLLISIVFIHGKVGSRILVGFVFFHLLVTIGVQYHLIFDNYVY